MSTRYLRLLVATALITTSLWLLYTFGDLPQPPPKKNIPNTPEDNPEPHTNATRMGEGTQLKPHGLKNISPYADVSTIRFHVNFTDAPVPLYQEVTGTLPRFAKIDTSDFGLAPYAWRIDVTMPKAPVKVDGSVMIFGIATNLPRLSEGLEAMRHWAGNSGAKVIVVVSPKDDKKDLTVDGLTQKARDMGIDLEIVERDAEFVNRYMLMVKILHQYMIPETQWAALLDDDTFFPSMTRLLKVLHKYNYKEQHYVGALTEDLDAIPKWGYMAYGGAGVYLSRALLDKLQANFDECNKSTIPSADGRLAECIYKFTTTKFTWEKQFFQFDIFGDYSGVFEAVRPLPISVHHWKSWGKHDMVLSARVSKICGDLCVFQKIQLADGWFLTNGFSIVKFSEKGKGDHGDGDHKSPDILPHLEGSMERTWKKGADETPTKFLHSFAPLRPKDDGKRQYLLEAAIEEDPFAMTHYYVKRVGGEAFGIIRIIWTKDW